MTGPPSNPSLQTIHAKMSVNNALNIDQQSKYYYYDYMQYYVSVSETLSHGVRLHD
jgi:hypothetical protein